MYKNLLYFLYFWWSRPSGKIPKLRPKQLILAVLYLFRPFSDPASFCLGSWRLEWGEALLVLSLAGIQQVLWGQLTQILSVTMFSNYHSLHTDMIAWLAVLFPWQLLWFWLCQSLYPSAPRGIKKAQVGATQRSVWGFFLLYFSLFTVEKL